MGAYTATSLVGVLAVLALELAWFRTGLLRRRTYWIGYAIVVFFQCLTDGWLTKLSAPIVLYADGRFLGIRFPADIPIEDFAFGWAMCTLTLLLWERQSRPADGDDEPRPRPPRILRRR